MFVLSPRKQETACEVCHRSLTFMCTVVLSPCFLLVLGSRNCGGFFGWICLGFLVGQYHHKQSFWEQWQKEGSFIRLGKTISLKQCYPQAFSTMGSKVWGERDVSRSCHFGFCSFSLTPWILCNTCSHTATSSECCISTSLLERTERVEMKRLVWTHSL